MDGSEDVHLFRPLAHRYICISIPYKLRIHLFFQLWGSLPRKSVRCLRLFQRFGVLYGNEFLSANLTLEKCGRIW